MGRDRPTRGRPRGGFAAGSVLAAALLAGVAGAEPPAPRPGLVSRDEASWVAADGRLQRLYRPRFVPAPGLAEDARALGVPGVEWALDPLRGRVVVTGTPEAVGRGVEALAFLDAARPAALVGVTVVETLRSCQRESGGALRLDRGAVPGTPDTFFRGFRHEFEPEAWLRDEVVGGRPFEGSDARFARSARHGAFAGLLDAVFRSLEASGEAAVVADPVLLCAEGVPASVSATLKLPTTLFLAQADRSASGAAVRSRQEVKYAFEKAGIELQVLVEAVGRDHVRLRVKPWLRQVAAGTGATGPAGAPILVERTLETLVTVPDGEMVVVGGLEGLRARRDRRGLPGLDALPGLDTWLSAREGESFTSDVLFVLRARVVRPGRPGPEVVPPTEVERLRGLHAGR